MKKWQFFADRGGTFTDIVAISPDRQITIHKLLSENPEHYQDAVIQGIRDVLGLAKHSPLPSEEIAVIKIGTTVATNALLERKGDRVVLAITKGFRDALKIGYQNRPHIFAREIILPEILYEQVIEVEERYTARGEELTPLNIPQVRQDLQVAYDQGIRSCAVVLMHAYRYPQHEIKIAEIAKEIGFSQISVSHQVSNLIKLVSRGDTTVVDAYLSPILRRYVEQISNHFSNNKSSPQLMFMQSNGGLTDASVFQGKDSILSGPAGGIVGAVKTCQIAGFKKIIGFDMGGTSTDVTHYAGEYERTLETEIAGVRLRTPMMSIHTIAAGGGSILQFDGARYRVGPESAGANPGPISYGKGGPLTVTDCNIMLGKLQPEFFPKVFGENADLPLNAEIVREQFTQLTQEIGDERTPEQVATGFLEIAIEKMANAIKKISLQRGYDVSEYTLCCFGGAAGQHACLIADRLGIKQIFIHPYAGVLSAYGIGLAEIRILREKSIEATLELPLISELEHHLAKLIAQSQEELKAQNPEQIEDVEIQKKIYLKYEGTDSCLTVQFGDIASMRQEFVTLHQQRYGFIMEGKNLIVETISIELICPTYTPEESIAVRRKNLPSKLAGIAPTYMSNDWYYTPVFKRETLQPGDIIPSPALIIEATGTNVLEFGWQAEISDRKSLILTKEKATDNSQQATVNIQALGSKPDSVLLEIFNNLFRSIAEQMGTTLQNTSYSVNIKERLDFSCAIFDSEGDLIANAPHIPVHLGSMSESIRSLIDAKLYIIKRGDIYLSNNPYNGGTHLPDLTVITPVFSSSSAHPLFYVASRGHHADIGGITPGSMPPKSRTIAEEGILIDNFLLVEISEFRERELSAILTSGQYPVRNLAQNIADLQAQIAANTKGMQELEQMIQYYGSITVCNYMIHVKNNANESVQKVVSVLQDGHFTCELDTGEKIQVNISINHQNRSAKIDFTGTSPQLNTNFNAPLAVCKAAVLYVFRSLVDDDIPLNAGCLKPLEIIIPEGCLLNPQYPAAVVAGNVETSQLIVDCLYGALGAIAGSQGTMNNFTFGNEKYQYYETICGGSGAGKTFHGTDAVQTNMTNSRLTDPEVLEWRFPVLLESFSIRPNSGGKGRYTGGNGVIRRVRFLESMTAGILSGRRIVSPLGLEGGNAGATGHNWVERKDGTVEELEGTAVVEMQPSDVFIIVTPGGGGYGHSAN
ncbi:hydantoinase B/oxoprolinase family protein [Spirulina sp. 06S082]|uniref:hydantoinase B/oxoprolinase family protein n=1 Tax=Spirulina sp. 06S082 TaxID=3110248 RepID=UPI002B2070F7|nr:hydantoinase B/oxoprolinase family protein [Spirulina sp. 06S082]MEA5471515.1 hydantoinase B/oxoprolinase family protein [Spirulina sp. 06S082]